ncbi:ADP-ribosylglycohydrolase family protein [Thermodesulfobacteriota bacterium]
MVVEMEKNENKMVFSSFAADSLALGVHWIYDTEIIRSKFGEVDRLLKPLEGSFHTKKEAGEFTHYGDQTLLLLESISEASRFELEPFAKSWFKFIETYKGYMDHATTDTIDNFKKGLHPTSSGSASTDLGGACRIAPLVFLYRDDPDKAAKASMEQTALTHNNSMVLDAAHFFSRVALKTLQGTPPVPALEQISSDYFKDTQIQQWTLSGIDSAAADTLQVILHYGQMCDINAAFPSVIHLIAKYSSDLKNGLIANVMSGGDSAARGMLVGMVLGAFQGSKSLPKEWISGMKAFDRIYSAIERLEKQELLD